jgi:arylsulfatase A-like enzyme
MASGYNVLLVTLDTTRRDRIGCYGCAWARTPTLDSLAAGGVLFDDAITSVPLTLPSHATLLTGLYPPRHGIRDNGRQGLAPERETLAEILASSGYETAAFIACFVLDARFGLDQGFGIYDFQVGSSGYRPKMPDFNERPANEVTDSAIRWLAKRAESGGASKPFFAWVHYFDPHLPYESPLAGQPDLAGRPYDAEIAFVDAQIGRLLGELGRRGLAERTIVVVVADHGEALGDHAEPTHGLFLYESTVRVPFLLYCPALVPGPCRVADRVVGLADVFPTLLDLLGIPTPGPVDGRSLVAAPADPGRAIYIETHAPFYLAGWSPLEGLRTHDSKYVLAPRPELYDLDADRAEASNLHASRPPGLALLEEELAALRGGWGPDAGAARELTDEEIERLRSLGYVQAGGAAAPGSLADPKEMVDVYNQSLEAERAYEAGRFEDAAAAARAVLDRCGSCSQATRVLAFSYVRLGRSADAVALLRESVRQTPNVFLVRSLAQVLIIQKQYGEAEEALRIYEALDAKDGRVPLLRGDCLAALGRARDAVAKYEEARRLDPNRVGIIAAERIARVNTARGGAISPGDGSQ